MGDVPSLVAGFKPGVYAEADGVVWVQVLLQTQRCHRCGKLLEPHGLAPVAAEQVGLELLPRGETGNGWEYCRPCSYDADNTFICAICGKERHMSACKMRGDWDAGTYHKRFCECCYETLPAAEWDRTLERMCRRK